MIFPEHTTNYSLSVYTSEDSTGSIFFRRKIYHSTVMWPCHHTGPIYHAERWCLWCHHVSKKLFLYFKRHKPICSEWSNAVYHLVNYTLQLNMHREDVCNIVFTISKMNMFNSLFYVISSLNHHLKMQRLGGEDVCNIVSTISKMNMFNSLFFFCYIQS